MSGRESIFDILTLNRFFRGPPRYYKCIMNGNMKFMECVKTDTEDGSISIPSSIPVGEEADFLSKGAKIPVKILS